MSKKPHPRLLYFGAGTLLALIILCALPGLNHFFGNFPENIFGQNALSGKSKPYDARAYQSAEFVLGQVSLADVEQAYFVQLSDDVLFWGPQYVGFPRTEISKSELIQIHTLLTNAVLFHPAPDGKSFECIQNQKLQPCPDGSTYQRTYIDRQWRATEKRAHAALVLFLNNGQLVEIHLAPSTSGLAFTPVEISGNWWLNGLSESSSLLDELSRRTSVSAIPTLWPELNADQANTKAAKILGKRYEKALEFIRTSQTIQVVFGEIHEIRPAEGSNYTSDWMDSNSIFLTLKVAGSHGKGAVIVQGDTCFDLRMVISGFPHEDGSSYICP